MRTLWQFLVLLSFLAVAAASNDTECPVCEPCFNCITSPSICGRAGFCGLGGVCECHPGVDGSTCDQKVCVSSLFNTTLTPRVPPAPCECEPGWAGAQCAVCTNDEVCHDPDDPEVVCDKSGYTQKDSRMTCDVATEIFGSLMNGGTPTVEMQFLREEREIFFQMWGTLVGEPGPREMFFCHLKNCTLFPRPSFSTFYDCKISSCSCYVNSFICGGGGAAAVGGTIQPFLASVGGWSNLTCDSDGKCSYHETFLEGLVGPVELSCKRGECTVPEEFPVVIERDPGATVALIAGVVGGLGGAIILIALILLAFIHVQRVKLKKKIESENIGENALDLLFSEKNIQNLSFKNISYYIAGKKKNTTTILHQVSGYVEGGQMMAIMGSSGSGKTTLLDIIARKTKAGVIDGEILVQGKKIEKKYFRQMSGYVDQEDCLFGSLTVRETILYAARLRLPSTMSYEEKFRRVQAVMVSLRIDHVADKFVGSSVRRGVSGGEKRRVSIACELVTTPSILFLDEPTSGLDSYSAFVVVQMLKHLALRSRMVVVMTIHQPRSNLFFLFDKLLLLSKGKPVYSGDLASSMDHFASIGYPCPPSFNPADHYLDITSTRSTFAHENEKEGRSSIEKSSPPAEEIELARIESTASPLFLEHQEKLTSSFANSQKAVELNNQIQLCSQEGREISLREGKPVGIFGQIYILSGRAFVNFYRDPMLMTAHFVIAIIIGVLMGGLFWQIDESLGGFQNRLGFVFFSLAIFGFGSLSSLETFAQERHIFMVERANGYYNPFSYFVSKILFDNIPLRILPPIIFTAIAYFMAGLDPDPNRFLRFLLVIVLFNLTAGSFAILFGSLFRNKGVANLLGSLAMLFSLLLSGFLINKDKMPAALGWIQFLSFFNYAFEALLVNEMIGKNVIDSAAGVNVNLRATVLLEVFGFNPNNYVPDTIILASFYVFYLLLSFLALTFLIKQKK